MLTIRHAATAADKFAVLNCRRLPGRLNSAETALLLGVQEHDIGTLVATKLLAPLGKPAPNAPKYFASVEIMTLAENSSWLSEATRTIAKHWAVKNGRKRGDGRISIGS